MTIDVDHQKNTLRQHMRVLRNTLQQSQPLAGQQLANQLLAWSIVRPEHTISAYWPINSEIDIRSYIQARYQQGGQVALPVVDPVNHQLHFHLWQPGLHMAINKFNIQQPDGACPQIDPDIVLLPLLAFDSHGYRLGYGRGHYDRTLYNRRTRKSLIAVGVGFDEQYVQTVPHDQYDQKLDYAVTPTRIHCF